jgi:hydrogenase nickel incorporation protein HypA/HybF
VHELSIAEAVVEIALRHAAGREVERVELRVGHLRQVVPSALEFAFELLSDGTVLQGAELVIEDVPVSGRCRACGTVSEMVQFPLQCTGCEGLDLTVLTGEELLVEAIELEEEMTTKGIGHGR